MSEATKVLGSMLQDVIPSEKVTASFKTYLLEVAIRSHNKLQGNRELLDVASSLRTAVLHRPSYSAMTSQPAVRSPAPQHRPSSVGTAATPCSLFTAGCVGRPFAHHRPAMSMRMNASSGAACACGRKRLGVACSTPGNQHLCRSAPAPGHRHGTRTTLAFG